MRQRCAHSATRSRSELKLRNALLTSHSRALIPANAAANRWHEQFDIIDSVLRLPTHILAGVPKSLPHQLNHWLVWKTTMDTRQVTQTKNRSSSNGLL